VWQVLPLLLLHCSGVVLSYLSLRLCVSHLRSVSTAHLCFTATGYRLENYSGVEMLSVTSKVPPLFLIFNCKNNFGTACSRALLEICNKILGITKPLNVMFKLHF
jgi:hypothetical protein